MNEKQYLFDWDSQEWIREATADEIAESRQMSENGDMLGVIIVKGRRCRLFYADPATI